MKNFLSFDTWSKLITVLLLIAVIIFAGSIIYSVYLKQAENEQEIPAFIISQTSLVHTSVVQSDMEDHTSVDDTRLDDTGADDTGVDQTGLDHTGVEDILIFEEATDEELEQSGFFEPSTEMEEEFKPAKAYA